ncbi:MAG: hypothetical protein ACM3QZ_10430 [Solirubrobacterales bacterium]
MRCYVNLPAADGLTIARALNGKPADHPRDADLCLVFGGEELQDPRPHLGRTNLVFPGELSVISERFADRAISAGVSPENIYFSGDRKMDIVQLLALIQERNITIDQSRPAKVIGFVGPKGGLGRTTFAASLVAHYNNTSETAALLECGAVQNGPMHIGSSEYGSVLYNEPIADAAAAYRRLVVDASPGFEDPQQYHRTILIVDADVIQTIEPAREYLQLHRIKPHAVIYNRCRAEVSAKLVEAYFPGIRVIPVEDDFSNCMAALAAGTPAAEKSPRIARAIGELAALIDRQERRD